MGAPSTAAPPALGICTDTCFEFELSTIDEISNLQLTGSGEIGMMQLNLTGHGPKRAA